jgi:hypothetical protein
VTDDEVGRLRRMVELADDLGTWAVPAPWTEQLRSLCATARLVLGAAAVSLARVDRSDDAAGPELVYVAADGAGAAEIEGVRLPAGRGLAGFVAATGQSLAVERVADDPRFARDVAESTGYVPASMLAVPVGDGDGMPVGVMSVLDRNGTGGGVTSADALVVTSSFAAIAAPVLTRADLLARMGPVLCGALAEAAGSDEELADLLRRAAGGPPTDELAGVAGLLAELRTSSPETRAAIERVLDELLALSTPRRRR